MTWLGMVLKGESFGGEKKQKKMEKKKFERKIGKIGKIGSTCGKTP